ncbi:MAG: hypothetical protein BWY22_00713 [Bacteroidetes bacterium ADurb.Bin217]|nr:MAG: hypothetical protein BWY22_00713 [Bacteroidetes bacterium ADurb.Bin217]HOS84290.1 hypothetical protein [Bacteroidales bacterium]
MKFQAVCFYIGIILLASCSTYSDEIDKEFVGEWRYYYGDEYYSDLIITDKGIGDYQETHYSKGAGFSGRVTIHDDILKVGQKKFKIVSYPRLIDTLSANQNPTAYKAIHWQMELIGPMFYISSGVYNKYERLEE